MRKPATASDARKPATASDARKPATASDARKPATASEGVRSPSTRHHRETARFKKIAEKLASRLRSLRQKRRFTIDEASEACGVEPMTWYRLEHGKANPTLALLASLAAMFELQLSELLADDEPAGRAAPKP